MAICTSDFDDLGMDLKKKFAGFKRYKKHVHWIQWNRNTIKLKVHINLLLKREKMIEKQRKVGRNFQNFQTVMFIC